MYLGVDIGGTKTLVTVLDEHGVVVEQVKFPTPPDYSEFLTTYEQTIAGLTNKVFLAGAVGMPVTVFDRDRGVGVSYGNLPWREVPVQADLERLSGCRLVVDNDAKLAGLSEAMLLKDQYQRVLYVTVSTGIGIGLTVHQTIDDNVGDSGGRAMMIQHHGKLQPWESFASGKAIVARFNKRAEDIHDEATWKIICHNIAQGLIELIALLEPEVIVIGGSVGTYFERYGHILNAAVKQYELPLVPMPAIVGAQRAEQAVIYGCYDIIKQTFPEDPATADAATA